MIIGNFKSKADELEQRANAMKLLQIGVDNEAEIIKRFQSFVAGEVPPVPPQHKSLVELEKDEFSIRNKLIEGLKQLGLEDNTIANAIQAFIASGKGIEDLIVLNRSIPAISRRFKFLNPKYIDANYLTDIFNSVIREYNSTSGFTNIGKDNETLLFSLPDEKDLEKLTNILYKIRSDLMAHHTFNYGTSTIGILINSIGHTLAFNREFINMVKHYITRLTPMEVDKLFEIVKVLNNLNYLYSRAIKLDIMELSKANNIDDITIVLNKLQRKEISDVLNKQLAELSTYLPDDVSGELKRLLNKEFKQNVISTNLEKHDTDQMDKALADISQSKIDTQQSLKEFNEEMEAFNKEIEDIKKGIKLLEENKKKAPKNSRPVLQAQIDLEKRKEQLAEYIKKTVMVKNKYYNIKDLKDFYNKALLLWGENEEKNSDYKSVKEGLDKANEKSDVANKSSYYEAKRIEKIVNKKLDTDPTYDPEKNPISEKIGFGTKEFKPQRIKIGKGIQIENTQPKWSTFGKYVLHNGQLAENRLNLKYPSLGTIPHIKPTEITDNYRDFILDILAEGRPNVKHYESLIPDEQIHFNKVIEGAGLTKVFNLKKVPDKDEQEQMKRFEVLKGSLFAGNNNPQMIKELSNLTVKFIKGGKLNKKQGEELLYYLLEIQQ